ncbi:MAG: pyrimidine dimer DNA glycosylase/endonuclease V [Candidatus Hodarchaeota archaeon]
MRLWSIHPKYLDGKGLVALWREALLAQKVLLGQTKGYRHHPQLERFKKQEEPVAAIGSYLYHVYREAKNRGYYFNKKKIITPSEKTGLIQISEGQISFELEHLKEKLKARDQKQYEQLLEVVEIDPHPIFEMIAGEREDWEKSQSLK